MSIQYSEVTSSTHPEPLHTSNENIITLPIQCDDISSTVNITIENGVANPILNITIEGLNQNVDVAPNNIIPPVQIVYDVVEHSDIESDDDEPNQLIPPVQRVYDLVEHSDIESEDDEPNQLNPHVQIVYDLVDFGDDIESDDEPNLPIPHVQRVYDIVDFGDDDD